VGWSIRWSGFRLFRTDDETAQPFPFLIVHVHKLDPECLATGPANSRHRNAKRRRLIRKMNLQLKLGSRLDRYPTLYSAAAYRKVCQRPFSADDIDG
jgi:hypothetical protein